MHACVCMCAYRREHVWIMYARCYRQLPVIRHVARIYASATWWAPLPRLRQCLQRSRVELSSGTTLARFWGPTWRFLLKLVCATPLQRVRDESDTVCEISPVPIDVRIWNHGLFNDTNGNIQQGERTSSCMVYQHLAYVACIIYKSLMTWTPLYTVAMGKQVDICSWKKNMTGTS